MKNRITALKRTAFTWITLAFLSLVATFLFSAYSHTPVEIRTLAATVRYNFLTNPIFIIDPEFS